MKHHQPPILTIVRTTEPPEPSAEQVRSRVAYLADVVESEARRAPDDEIAELLTGLSLSLRRVATLRRVD